MSDATGAPPPERWLDIVRVAASNDDCDEAEKLGRQILKTGLPSLGFDDLPQTEFERQAVLDVQQVINIIRRKCGQSPFSVSPDRIQVVTAESLHKELGHDCSGYEMLGRVYLIDTLRSRPEDFAYTLSHEMAHLSSYSAAWFSFDIEESKAILTDITQTRSGLQRFGPNNKPECTGLNEAVTEYLGSLVRILLSREEGEFAKHCAVKAFTIDTDYATITALCNTLCRELAGGYRDDWTCVSDVWACLLTDYWSGSDEFLNFLTRPFPDMVADLKQLDTERQNVQQFANKYGLQIDYGTKK